MIKFEKNESGNKTVIKEGKIIGVMSKSYEVITVKLNNGKKITAFSEKSAKNLIEKALS